MRRGRISRTVYWMGGLAAGVMAAGSALAQHPAQGPAPRPAIQGPAAPPLRPVRFRELPGWTQDRQDEVLPALRATCEGLRDLPPEAPLGGSGIASQRAGTVAAWRAPCEALRALQASMPEDLRPAPGTRAPSPRWQRRIEVRHAVRAAMARAFLEQRFEAFAAGTGLMTGYYEPVLRGAPAPDASFRTPLYARPPELAEEAGATPAQRRFGVLREGRLEPFPDRAAIEGGALAGRGLELAWVEDPVAAFFLHIQGSGRVAMPDGTVQRLGYAAQNGQPYVPIGRVLIERAEIPRERMSMQAIRAWLRDAGTARAAEVMATNPSFVFFRRIEGLAPDQGPIGALGVPLTPGRSVAVDRAFIPLGLPLFVAARDPVDGAPLQRAVVAQDTGGAIRGPARSDFFWGWGEEAGERAGLMRETAQIFLLLPRAP